MKFSTNEFYVMPKGQILHLVHLEKLIGRATWRTLIIPKSAPTV